MTTSGDTQALPRIPVHGGAAGPAHPTVALTIALVPEPVPARAEEPVLGSDTEDATEVAAEPAPDAPAESHERIYEEAMATIAALASSWSSSVQRASGRHRGAA